MMNMDVHEEYARILEESRRRGDVVSEHAGQERRIHPRLAVTSADIWISSVPEFTMVDLSISGLALMANYPLKPGEQITISMGTALSIEAEVVKCQLVESPTDYSDAVFRIQCRFAEELKGMELVVQIKKREYAN
jgi:hypothetical protein